MQEVIVLIHGERMRLQAVRAFHWKTPKTDRYGVGFMAADREKWVRLSCPDGQEAAKTLAQKIRDGTITDLTAYPAEWN